MNIDIDSITVAAPKDDQQILETLFKCAGLVTQAHALLVTCPDAECDCYFCQMVESAAERLKRSLDDLSHLADEQRLYISGDDAAD